MDLSIIELARNSMVTEETVIRMRMLGLADCASLTQVSRVCALGRMMHSPCLDAFRVHHGSKYYSIRACRRAEMIKVC